MNTEKLYLVFNEIEKFISPSKLEDFRKYLEENDFKIEINKKVKTKKVPKDLKERLFQTCETEMISYNMNDETSNDELTKICKSIFNYLDIMERRNKNYYYNLGMALYKIKSTYDNDRDFLKFTKKEFKRNKTTIYDYIRFYLECENFPLLLSCNLTYREITKNFPEVKKLLNQPAGEVIHKEEY